MKCPLCGDQELVTGDLEPGFDSATCGKCKGSWINGSRYLAWVQADPVPETQHATALATDSGPGRRCPECGHFLHRAAVSADIPFTLQRCGTCGGFWLDGGEWEALKANGLALRLHHIFSDSWQRKVSQAKHAERTDHLWAEKLGNEMTEARRIKDWLDAHPRRSEVLAYLLGQPPA